MELILDRDLKSVLEFMQSNVKVSKLIGISESLPQIARLLWEQYPQEPFKAVYLNPKPLSISCEKQLTAIG